MLPQREPSELQADATEFAYRAVDFDRSKQLDAAIYYYCEAAQCLQAAFQSAPELTEALKSKALEYVKRAEELKKIKESSSVPSHAKDEQQQDLEMAEFLLRQALDEDESGNKEEAIDLYTQAVELCLKARHKVADNALKTKLGTLAEQALDRAEKLKGVEMKRAASPGPAPSPQTSQPLATPQQSTSFAADISSLVVTGRDTYTAEEIKVLKRTSVINGREYVPFMSVDLKERFAFPMPFSDRDGLPALSPKQKAVFHSWVRPQDISANPQLFDPTQPLTCFQIKQTIVSDCSFIASLAVSAHYERRFKKQILTDKIFPQTRKGQPVFNPCGKYMLKFHINGIHRKVIIDDRLPLGVHRQLLCSYSRNPDEFWVSLYEKAYMKVMGGYDFPGSNSNIDLHALTGWIPERISIGPDESAAEKSRVFRLLLDKHHRGDLLATVATGNLSEAIAQRAGLVPTHAYALLDVREILGKRLLLLKNPWSEQRWKGNFSEQDTSNWTPQLKEALKYDPKNAKMFDNGIFWIDYESVLHFFDVFHVNWNPDIFKYTSCLHQTWAAGQGPAKDLYTVAENPQFRLEVKSPGSVVWLLLTRHITDRNDFAENQEFITLLVYKSDGKKVYYQHDPAPYIDGVRINSPHYLCKLLVPREGSTRYTLVVSQYCKMNNIHFTLRGYGSVPFSLSPIPNPYKYKQEVKNGQWTVATAGGCANHPMSYGRNPIYQVSASDSSAIDLLVELKGPKQYSVGVDVVAVSVSTGAPGYIAKKSSGAYRPGYTIVELERVPSGVYNVIPSTFYPDQKGPFILTVRCSVPVKLAQIQ